MMPDTLTLACGAAVLLLALITPMLNPFFRKLGREDEEQGEASEALGISVILTPHDEAEALERNLPALLGQDYAPGFEVIVVAEKGDSDTEDVLKRIANANPSAPLYVTFIPEGSRYMSRKKLAITLGVKAAKNEWILMTDASCRPASSLWLQSMAAHMRPSTALVLGYANYAPDAPAFLRFEQLRTASYLLRKAQRGTAYRTNSTNVAFRKSAFTAQDGYRDSLHVERGEYDFLVNKYAQKGNTVVALSPDSWVTDEEYYPKKCLAKALHTIHAKQFLLRSHPMAALHRLDTIAMTIAYLAIAASIAFAASTERWVLLGIAILSLLVVITWRTVLARKVIARFDGHIAAWKVVPFELALPWRDALLKMRYLRADKMDFTTHKL